MIFDIQRFSDVNITEGATTVTGKADDQNYSITTTVENASISTEGIENFNGGTFIATLTTGTTVSVIIAADGTITYDGDLSELGGASVSIPSGEGEIVSATIVTPDASYVLNIVDGSAAADSTYELYDLEGYESANESGDANLDDFKYTVVVANGVITSITGPEGAIEDFSSIDVTLSTQAGSQSDPESVNVTGPVAQYENGTITVNGETYNVDATAGTFTNAAGETVTTVTYTSVTGTYTVAIENGRVVVNNTGSLAPVDVTYTSASVTRTVSFGTVTLTLDDDNNITAATGAQTYTTNTVVIDGNTYTLSVSGESATITATIGGSDPITFSESTGQTHTTASYSVVTAAGFTVNFQSTDGSSYVITGVEGGTYTTNTVTYNGATYNVTANGSNYALTAAIERAAGSASTETFTADATKTVNEISFDNGAFSVTETGGSFDVASETVNGITWTFSKNGTEYSAISDGSNASTELGIAVAAVESEPALFTISGTVNGVSDVSITGTLGGDITTATGVVSFTSSSVTVGEATYTISYDEAASSLTLVNAGAGEVPEDVNASDVTETQAYVGGLDSGTAITVGNYSLVINDNKLTGTILNADKTAVVTDASDITISESGDAFTSAGVAYALDAEASSGTNVVFTSGLGEATITDTQSAAAFGQYTQSETYTGSVSLSYTGTDGTTTSTLTFNYADGAYESASDGTTAVTFASSGASSDLSYTNSETGVTVAVKSDAFADGVLESSEVTITRDFSAKALSDTSTADISDGVDVSYNTAGNVVTYKFDDTHYYAFVIDSNGKLTSPTSTVGGIAFKSNASVAFSSTGELSDFAAVTATIDTSANTFTVSSGLGTAAGTVTVEYSSSTGYLTMKPSGGHVLTGEVVASAAVGTDGNIALSIPTTGGGWQSKGNVTLTFTSPTLEAGIDESGKAYSLSVTGITAKDSAGNDLGSPTRSATYYIAGDVKVTAGDTPYDFGAVTLTGALADESVSLGTGGVYVKDGKVATSTLTTTDNSPKFEFTAGSIDYTGATLNYDKTKNQLTFSAGTNESDTTITWSLNDTADKADITVSKLGTTAWSVDASTTSVSNALSGATSILSALSQIGGSQSDNAKSTFGTISFDTSGATEVGFDSLSIGTSVKDGGINGTQYMHVSFSSSATLTNGANGFNNKYALSSNGLMFTFGTTDDLGMGYMGTAAYTFNGFKVGTGGVAYADVSAQIAEFGTDFLSGGRTRGWVPMVFSQFGTDLYFSFFGTSGASMTEPPATNAFGTIYTAGAQLGTDTGYGVFGKMGTGGYDNRYGHSFYVGTDGNTINISNDYWLGMTLALSTAGSTSQFSTSVIKAGAYAFTLGTNTYVAAIGTDNKVKEIYTNLGTSDYYGDETGEVITVDSTSNIGTIAGTSYTFTFDTKDGFKAMETTIAQIGTTGAFSSANNIYTISNFLGTNSGIVGVDADGKFVAAALDTSGNGSYEANEAFGTGATFTLDGVKYTYDESKSGFTSELTTNASGTFGFSLSGSVKEANYLTVTLSNGVIESFNAYTGTDASGTAITLGTDVSLMLGGKTVVLGTQLGTYALTADEAKGFGTSVGISVNENAITPSQIATISSALGSNFTNGTLQLSTASIKDANFSASSLTDEDVVSIIASDNDVENTLAKAAIAAGQQIIALKVGSSTFYYETSGKFNSSGAFTGDTTNDKLYDAAGVEVADANTYGLQLVSGKLKLTNGETDAELTLTKDTATGVVSATTAGGVYTQIQVSDGVSIIGVERSAYQNAEQLNVSTFPSSTVDATSKDAIHQNYIYNKYGDAATFTAAFTSGGAAGVTYTAESGGGYSGVIALGSNGAGLVDASGTTVADIYAGYTMTDSVSGFTITGLYTSSDTTSSNAYSGTEVSVGSDSQTVVIGDLSYGVAASTYSDVTVSLSAGTITLEEEVSKLTIDNTGSGVSISRSYYIDGTNALTYADDTFTIGTETWAASDTSTHTFVNGDVTYKIVTAEDGSVTSMTSETTTTYTAADYAAIEAIEASGTVTAGAYTFTVTTETGIVGVEGATVELGSGTNMSVAWTDTANSLAYTATYDNKGTATFSDDTLALSAQLLGDTGTVLTGATVSEAKEGSDASVSATLTINGEAYTINIASDTNLIGTEVANGVDASGNTVAFSSLNYKVTVIDDTNADGIVDFNVKDTSQTTVVGAVVGTTETGSISTATGLDVVRTSTDGGQTWTFSQNTYSTGGIEYTLIAGSNDQFTAVASSGASVPVAVESSTTSIIQTISNVTFTSAITLTLTKEGTSMDNLTLTNISGNGVTYTSGSLTVNGTRYTLTENSGTYTATAGQSYTTSQNGTITSEGSDATYSYTLATESGTTTYTVRINGSTIEKQEGTSWIALSGTETTVTVQETITWNLSIDNGAATATATSSIAGKDVSNLNVTQQLTMTTTYTFTDVNGEVVNTVDYLNEVYQTFTTVNGVRTAYTYTVTDGTPPTVSMTYGVAGVSYEVAEGEDDPVSYLVDAEGNVLSGETVYTATYGTASYTGTAAEIAAAMQADGIEEGSVELVTAAEMVTVEATYSAGGTTVFDEHGNEVGTIGEDGTATVNGVTFSFTADAEGNYISVEVNGATSEIVDNTFTIIGADDATLAHQDANGNWVIDDPTAVVANNSGSDITIADANGEVLGTLAAGDTYDKGEGTISDDSGEGKSAIKNSDGSVATSDGKVDGVGNGTVGYDEDGNLVLSDVPSTATVNGEELPVSGDDSVDATVAGGAVTGLADVSDGASLSAEAAGIPIEVDSGATVALASADQPYSINGEEVAISGDEDGVQAKVADDGALESISDLDDGATASVPAGVPVSTDGSGDFNVNGNPVSVAGDSDGVTITDDTVSGVSDDATVGGSGINVVPDSGADEITLADGFNGSVNGSAVAVNDDEDGVKAAVSDGKLTGLSDLDPGASVTADVPVTTDGNGTFGVNGDAIEVAGDEDGVTVDPTTGRISGIDDKATLGGDAKNYNLVPDSDASEVSLADAGTWSVNGAPVTFADDADGVVAEVADGVLTGISDVDDGAEVTVPAGTDVKTSGAGTVGVNGQTLTTDDANGITVTPGSGSDPATVSGLDNGAILSGTGSVAIGDDTYELGEDSSVKGGANGTASAYTQDQKDADDARQEANDILSDLGLGSLEAVDDSVVSGAVSDTYDSDTGVASISAADDAFKGNKEISISDANLGAADAVVMDFSGDDGIKLVEDSSTKDLDLQFGDSGNNTAIIGKKARGEKNLKAGNPKPGKRGDNFTNNSPNAEVTMTGGTGNDYFKTADSDDVVDLSGGGADSINAMDGASVTGYNPDEGATFIVEETTQSALVNDIQDGTLKFNNPNDFSFVDDDGEEHAVSLDEADTSKGTFVRFTTEDNDEKLYGFSGRAGGALDGSGKDEAQILVGNFSNDNLAATTTITGGTGDDTFLAGAGDNVQLGNGGNDLVSLSRDADATEGAKVGIGDGNTNSSATVEGFVGGFDNNADKVAVSGDGNFSFKRNSLGLLELVFGAMALAFKGARSIAQGLGNYEERGYSEAGGQNDVMDNNGVFEFLGETADGAGARFALLDNTNSTVVAGTEQVASLAVDDDYGAVTNFYGQEKVDSEGKLVNSTIVDFTKYDETLNANVYDTVSAGNHFYNIASIKGGRNDTTLVGGNDNNNVLIAGAGATSVLGGSGTRDSLFGYDGNDVEKRGQTEFFYVAGQGLDTVSGFDFGSEDTNDKVNTYGQDVTSAWFDENNALHIQVGDDKNDQLQVNNAFNKVMQVNTYGKDWVVEFGDKLVYNDDVEVYGNAATSNNEVSVTAGGAAEDTVAIYANGFDGKGFINVSKLSASQFNGVTTLVGGEFNDSVVASKGGSSLWGGESGDDTLVAGSGDDEFFYLKGNGNDVITGASASDVVNLMNVSIDDIDFANSTIDRTAISLKVGDNTLKVTGNAQVAFQLEDGTQWVADRTKKTWSQKSES